MRPVSRVDCDGGRQTRRPLPSPRQVQWQKGFASKVGDIASDRESCAPCLQWFAKYAAFAGGRTAPTATGRWFELRFQTSSRQGDQGHRDSPRRFLPFRSESFNFASISTSHAQGWVAQSVSKITFLA